MKCKHIKLIMEKIFIFILPLAFILPCIKVVNNYVYDNNGNYEEKEKTIVFDSPLNLTTSVISTYIYNDFDFVDDISINNVEELNTTYHDYYFDIESMYCESPHHEDLSLYFYAIPDNCFYDGDMNYEFYCDEDYVVFYDNDGRNPLTILMQCGYFYDLLADISPDGILSFSADIYEKEIVNLNTITYVDDLSFIGKIKNIFIDFLDFNDSFLLDLFITYTYLWIMFFIAWHLFYRLFDFVMHIADRERRKE